MNQNSSDQNQRPFHIASDGGLWISTWRNDGKEPGSKVYSSKVSKSYQDPKTGEMRITQSLSASDLPRLALLAPQAYAAIQEDKARLREIEDDAPEKEHWSHPKMEPPQTKPRSERQPHSRSRTGPDYG